MKDITPERYQCVVGSRCQKVYDLGDGRYAIRGKLIEYSQNLPNRCVEHVFPRASAEAVIEIDPQLIIAALKEQLWSED